MKLSLKHRVLSEFTGRDNLGFVKKQKGICICQVDGEKVNMYNTGTNWSKHARTSEILRITNYLTTEPIRKGIC